MSDAPRPRRGRPPDAASVADKRFRRSEVRPGKRRRLGQRIWQVARAGLVVGGLMAAGALVSARAVDARLLAVDRVIVQGNHRLTVGEVEAIVSDLRGANLLLVNLGRVQARLLDSPWVASVTLRRVLPSTVDIRIVEREPMAIARLGQQLYLVDDAGTIIDEYGPQHADFDLPIVDGLATGTTAGGPAIDPGRAQLTARLLRALAPRPDVRRALSQVDVSRPQNVVVLLGDDPTLLHLGDEQFLARLQTYLELTPALAERERAVEYVDLRFGHRVFIKDRK